MAKKVKIYHVNEAMRGNTINLPDVGDVKIDEKDGSVTVSEELAVLLTQNSPSWKMEEDPTKVMDNEEAEIEEEEVDPELEEDEVEDETEEEAENDDPEEDEVEDETEEEAENDDPEEDGGDDEEEDEEEGEFPKSKLNKLFSFNELKEFCEGQKLKGSKGLRSKSDLLKFLEENWGSVSDEAKAQINKMK